MAEKDLWATMRDHVKRHGHFERIENMVGIGRPDVNYCIRGTEGNIELKQLERWPTRPDTPVAVPHYTAQQRLWHRTRLSAGGRVYVLLEVMRPRPSYYLLSAHWTREYLGRGATRADIEQHALCSGVGSFPTIALVNELAR